jgi:hypothetical protein
MKIRNILSPLILLLGSFLLSSNSVTAQTSTTTTIFSYGENEVSYKYTDLDFLNTPSWKPEEGEPPVSLQRAMAVARTNLQRFVKNAGDLKVKNLVLHAFGKDNWLYDISFDCSTEECKKSVSGQLFMIYVKMDGLIIEPKITLRKEKVRANH